jgi:hypothetical protein
VLLAAAALPLAGCGLADYEARMSSEAALVQNWDEESRLLGPPINPPGLPQVDGKDVSWNVFLCLPLGVAHTPVTLPKSNLAQLYGGQMAQYQGGTNKFGLQNVYVGQAVDQKDYPATVFSVFGVPPGGEAPLAPAILRSPLLRAYGKNLGLDVPLKRKISDGPPAYSFNFYEHGNVSVAVVFQSADNKVLQNAEKAIRMSLSTLAEGMDANNCRTAYKKTHGKGAKK